MTRPGVEVVSRAAPPARGYPSETGTWFVAGLTDRGPVDKPVVLQNMGDYTKHYGDRVTYSVLYDALDVFFREGGTKAVVIRVVGPNATVDTVNLADAAAADTLAVDSIGPGATGLSVAVLVGRADGSYVLQILLDGVEVERTPDLFTPTDAVTWSSGSSYVRVRSIGANNPAVVDVTALGGGSDDRAGITDDNRVAALGLFDETYGPGQVSIPGATTTAAQVGVLDHAQAFNRFALLDEPDSPSSAVLIATNDALRGVADPASLERGAIFGPWEVVPGFVRGTTRITPPSAETAGLIARSDSVTSNPNIPAAGENGEARYALDLSQPNWDGATRQELNESGVNVFRSLFGAVRLYGYRTLVDPDGPSQPWLSIAAARTRMAIENDAKNLGESFMFDQIDGKGLKVAEFNGALTGLLSGYWKRGALYGETAADAFVVDTGPSVNTPETLANNELHAVIGLRMSPFAELVYIEVVKVPITEAL